MSTTADVQALDRLLDPVRDCLTKEVAERIVALRADDADQQRIDQLAEKHAEGVLSASDQAEYDAYIGAGNLIAVLQAKARAVLKNGS